jgi:23S rRNA (cytosine1962-C5)-methyltransferase
MIATFHKKFPDYELIDSGTFEKLERFGKYILRRPEPQAIWDKTMSESEWEKMAHASFRRSKKRETSTDSGDWVLKKGMPEQWNIEYVNDKGLKIKFRLGLTSFKHVGVFPEQATNWDYIYEHATKLPNDSKVLNLFAYTGGASLVSKAAGTDITHVDAIRQVVTWSKENMELSGLKDIRWVVEDALKFAEREVKRGKLYQGIMLDPPVFGHGPNGELWKLEEHLYVLLQHCKQLLDPNKHFFILNLYSLGFSPFIAENLIKSIFGKVSNAEFGEVYNEDKFGKKLPLGIVYRFSK